MMKKINKKIKQNVNMRNARSAVSNFVDWSIPVSIVLISLFTISYIMLVSMTTIKSASMKNVEMKISSITEEINNAENKLTEMTNHINLGLAEQLGFVEAKKIQYLSNEPIKAAFRTNEI